MRLPISAGPLISCISSTPISSGLLDMLLLSGRGRSHRLPYDWSGLLSWRVTT